MSDATHCQTIVSRVIMDNCHGLCHLSNVHVQYGNFRKVTYLEVDVRRNERKM